MANFSCVLYVVLQFLLHAGGTRAQDISQETSSGHSASANFTNVQQTSSALDTINVSSTHSHDVTSTRVSLNTHTSSVGISVTRDTSQSMRNHRNTPAGATPPPSSTITLGTTAVLSSMLSASRTQSVLLSTSLTQSVLLSTSLTQSVLLSSSRTQSVLLSSSRTQNVLMSSSRTQNVLMSSSLSSSQVMSATSSPAERKSIQTQTEPNATVGSSPRSIPTSVPVPESPALDYKLILYIVPPLFILVVIMILIALALCVHRFKRVRRYRQHLMPLQEMEGSDDESDNEEDLDIQENREDKEAAFTITYPDRNRDKTQRPILAFRDDH